MNNIPTITRNLLVINVVVFLATYVFRGLGIDLNDLLGLHFMLAPDFHFYQLFTYMFAHGGWSHIFFNMFALWMFGCIVERTWGPRKFLFYYIACGVGPDSFRSWRSSPSSTCLPPTSCLTSVSLRCMRWQQPMRVI